MKSIFKTKQAEQEYYDYYDQTLELFEVPHKSLYVPSTYGDTHILAFGDSSKKPLLLLHGMTMSSTMWYPNIRQLIRERYVLTVDIVGDFGKSKPVGAIKNKRDPSQWLLEVMDGLQLETTDLAGHSMGGFLALDFALAHPNRVSKLLLYAPAATFYKLNPHFFIKIYPALLFHTDRMIDRTFRWFSGNDEPLHPVFRSQVISGYRHAKPLLYVMASVFPDEAFRDYDRPTLLLVGEKEVIYPATRVIEQAKRRIPNVEAHLIPGANHSLTIEHAHIVNELSLRFLASK